jgi:two-component system response regulator AlgR
MQTKTVEDQESATPAPLRVLIVDDEQPARSRLRDLLFDLSESLPVVVVGEAAHGREAIVMAQSNVVDVVLLDVRMPVMDGVETAQHLQRLPKPPAVIFTTAYTHYAVQAFEVNALDYLLKPINATRLKDALARVAHARALRVDLLRAMQVNCRSFLSVLERGNVILIPISDIVYLRAELKYVTVRTHQREYLLDESLVQLEREFGERFVRVHRNCLIARAAIRGFERAGAEGDSAWQAVLEGITERVSVSRRQHHVIRSFKRL